MCERTFDMGDAGSSYSRFRRALAAGNLTLIRAAAAELATMSLADALHVCVLLCEREPQSFDRAGVRWLGRFCLEQPGASLADVEHVREAFSLLRTDPAAAIELLQAAGAPGAAALALARSQNRRAAP
jgi:hypothetical protein